MLMSSSHRCTPLASTSQCNLLPECVLTLSCLSHMAQPGRDRVIQDLLAASSLSKAMLCYGFGNLPLLNAEAKHNLMASQFCSESVLPAA